MLYNFLAELVVLLHFSFILFVLFGGLLAFKYPKIIWLHVPIAIYGMMISFFRWICPLTPLENHFRALAGEQGYGGGFIAHYILPVIYPDGITTGITILMGILVIVLNVIFYGIFFIRDKRS